MQHNKKNKSYAGEAASGLLVSNIIIKAADVAQGHKGVMPRKKLRKVGNEVS